MQINTDIWGTESDWLIDTALSNLSYSNTAMLIYNGKHRKINDYSEFLINEPIDYSICYCGHAQEERMPLADIAAIDYQGNTVATQEYTNGWFLATNNTVSMSYKLTTMINNAVGVASGDTDYITRSQVTRWLPLAAKYNSSYYGDNVNLPICPVVSFPLKAFYGSILVGLYHKTDKSIYTTVWLHDLEANIASYADNYYICKAYLQLYCYNGGGVSDISYSDFTRKDVIAAGAGFTQPLNVNGTNILSYTWACNSGYCNLPIFGDCNIGDTLNNIRGVRVFPYDWEHYGDLRGNNCAAIIYSNSLATYKEIVQTTDTYGYAAYLLRVGMDVTRDNIEKLRKGAAAYGIFFSDYNPETLKTDLTNTNRWTDSKMCLGVLDDENIGHGEYTRGTDNANNKIFDYDRSTDSNYDPGKRTDNNKYSNITDFNSLSTSAAMTRRYVLNAANVEKLGNDLWTICNDLATGGDFEYFDGKLKDEFLTTNPIDSIVSLQRFPFSIPHTFAPTKTAVRLGKTDGSAQGYLTNNPLNTIIFKGIDIFARFGNSFLDYEPFTSYELYVPFCGTTKIRAADILGHILNLTMQIDLITGNCTAYIMADSLVIETLNGSCGVDMQLSGIQTATVAANLYNGILGQQQAKTNMIAQGASALLPSSWVNPVGYAAKGEQAETTYKQATYAIEHTETPVHSIGSASALLAWVQEFNARLIIYYPEGDVINSVIPPSFNYSALETFGHLKGFATVNPGKVRDFQMQGKAAYLQGDIIAENIPCTQSERNKIKAFFAEGVYLPPIS